MRTRPPKVWSGFRYGRTGSRTTGGVRMSRNNGPVSWGPSHQTVPRTNWRSRIGSIVVFVVLLVVTANHPLLNNLISIVVLVVLVWWIVKFVYRHLPATWQTRLHARLPHLSRLQSPAIPSGDGMLARPGAYLGVSRDGRVVQARAERAVLVLGPPRSGKSSGVIIPTILSHDGPVVATSTKPDVINATRHAREGRGRVWQFDPTGTSVPPAGVTQLRWSPVLCAMEWDGALLMARAMVTGARTGAGVTDASHWTRRAQALLAPLLHAAALAGREIGDVADWVTRHETDQPGALLQEHDATPAAVSALVGLVNTEARERSSIFSAAADSLDAYTSTSARLAASEPNFFTGRFATSTDTVYIHAPGEDQQLIAPLVCGLLAEIRRATYRHHRQHTLPHPVMFALDEVANIAPLEELPQIASEGASQGLLLLAALQDLSQARGRWGPAADGFLTLFGTKLLLGGIVDQKTLETVSSALGEYDRRVVSHTSTRVKDSWLPQLGHTVSTQRQRVLSPGEIAKIPAGHALHLDGVAWELITLTPAHHAEPWRSMTQPTP